MGHGTRDTGHGDRPAGGGGGMSCVSCKGQEPGAAASADLLRRSVPRWRASGSCRNPRVSGEGQSRHHTRQVRSGLVRSGHVRSRHVTSRLVWRPGHESRRGESRGRPVALVALVAPAVVARRWWLGGQSRCRLSSLASRSVVERESQPGWMGSVTPSSPRGSTVAVHRPDASATRRVPTRPTAPGRRREGQLREI
ncbi:unnamed protein product [Diplocarpon coronariae]